LKNGATTKDGLRASPFLNPVLLILVGKRPLGRPMTKREDSVKKDAEALGGGTG